MGEHEPSQEKSEKKLTKIVYQAVKFNSSAGRSDNHQKKVTISSERPRTSSVRNSLVRHSKTTAN